MEYYSAIKKKEPMPSEATWINLKIIIVSEVSLTEKDKYHMTLLIWEKIFKWYKWTYLQNRDRFTDLENELSGQKGGRQG